MEQPMYLQYLLRQKPLLIVGVIVSIVAGLFAGYSFEDGEMTPRVDRLYSASATVLLTSSDPSYFQVEIPSVTQALPQADEEGAPPPRQELIVQERESIDLRANATILAYLASSDQITDTVGESVGGLGDQEAIIAVSRTTQPSGDERFPGRLSLPIIDIGATALTPARAELLATEATEAFRDMVVEQQNAIGVAEDIRLQLAVLNQPTADTGQGSNPAIPVVVVGFGVLMLFLAAALIIEMIRTRLRQGRDGADGEPLIAHRRRVEDPDEVATVGEDASARV